MVAAAQNVAGRSGALRFCLHYAPIAMMPERASMTTSDVKDVVTIVKDIVTIVGVLIAAVSLVFTWWNTRQTALTNRARFWLDLRAQFSKHDEVHRRLRPGGAWTDEKDPDAAEEKWDWPAVEAYMGLFEHCEIMLEQGLIDEQTFREIYRYRITNIVANDKIRIEKLVRRADGWRRFLALCKRMDVPVSEAGDR
jgi:hypothetical protein